MWEKRSHPGIEPGFWLKMPVLNQSAIGANSACVMGLDSNQTSNRTQFTHNNPIKTSLPPYDFDLLMKIVYGLLLLL